MKQNEHTTAPAQAPSYEYPDSEYDFQYPVASGGDVHCRWVPATMDRVHVRAEWSGELRVAELSLQQFRVLTSKQCVESLYLAGKVSVSSESELGLWLSLHSARA
jgi:hypothetical protein